MAVSQASFASADKVSHLGEIKIFVPKVIFSGYNPFLFCLGHEKSKPLVTQMSPLLTKAMRSGLWGHIVAFKRAPHVFVLISYGNNGPEQADVNETKKKQQGNENENGLTITNLLFDYDLCDQLLGRRRRREIPQRGRLFARRSDRGRSLWFPNLRTCRFILTFFVTYWLSLSSQISCDLILTYLI